MLSKLLICCFVLKGFFLQAQNLEWLAPVINNESNEFRTTETMILTNGNLMSAGLFIGTIDLDPGTEEHILQSQPQSQQYDIFTQELTPDGKFVKAMHFSPGVNSQLNYIGICSNGDIAISGDFWDEADLNPTNGTSFFTQPSSMIYKGQFVARLNENGQFLWKKVINQGGYLSNGGKVTFDKFGNIFVVCGTSLDTEVNKYSIDGDFMWGKLFLSSDYNVVTDVFTDSKGSVFVLGTGRSNIVCYPGMVSVFSNNTSSYVCSLDDTNDGEINWFKLMGSDSGRVYASQIIAKEDLLVIAGEYWKNADFSTDSNYQLSYPNGGYIDGFVSLLDTSGVVKWVNTVNGVYHESFMDIAIDSNNDIYTCGFKNDTIILRKLSIDGIEKWEQGFPTGHIAFENFVEVDSNFNIYAFGYSKNSVDINPSPQISTNTQGFYTRKISQRSENQTNAFLLYPNPISNSFTLFNQFYKENVTVRVHDFSGKLVAKHLFSDYQYTIDCSDLGNGAYIVTIEADNLLQKSRILINKE